MSGFPEEAHSHGGHEHHYFGPVPGLIELFTADVASGSLVDRTDDTVPIKRVLSANLATPADFYHYGCCGEADAGWGCAYRAVQSSLSCLKARLPRLSAVVIPNIIEIQMELFRLGVLPDKDVGSHRWIEPEHGAAYLKGVHGVECNPGALETSVGTASDLIGLMWSHFATHATVGMLDDGVYAYAVAGVCETDEPSAPPSKVMVVTPGPDSSLWRTQILLFDPHTPSTGMSLTDFKERRGKKARWVGAVDLLCTSTRWMYMFPVPL